ncbi:MAG: hypothetical protein AUJ85_09980 [Elusimicrobia bacterium CG1_02_37_114]|nr:MAG: hypothetical protein AUJ85_09980 [Elusimicrobia bacterium CG1_02_37_114]PIV53376.1 MAG: hypothetical protein COS17_04130 [Elusimicrobia bacterium CG02_land_8_20_14_3_00_37_13]PIZ13476.1 MAG: hypothetical protein COY53_04545 [Elusimicrobia bacterium CG_4_10_14_0_8_um_filter_37_32]
MQIRTVETEKDLMKFIKFQWKVYKNDPYWVPQLISDIKKLLNKNKNPFWKHSEQRLFLAENNGEIVGRIAGVIDRNYLEFHNEQTGFFAFFEAMNDYSVAELLLSAVENWLKEKGMKKMMGPTAPSTNDELGFLLEGFDSPPVLMMPYNPEYYHGLAEKYGLKKDKDLYAYQITEKTVPMERLNRLNEKIKRREPKLTIRQVNLKDYDNEIKRIREIYNNAWGKNWGFVPWTEEEFYYQCANLKPLVVPELVFFIYIGTEPVGMLVGVPNYFEVLKKLNGKMGPVELIKFLWYKNRIKTLRIMIMGVKKQYRNRGIEGIMFYEIVERGIKLGYKTAEMSWVLEDNIAMCRAAEMMGGKIYKKYRVYEKTL